MTGKYIYILLTTTIIILFAWGCKTKRIPPKPAISQTRQEYIARFSGLAVSEMERAGIPASITMAQALLESGDGNSTLARNSNNHFGIKCHNDWNGPTYRHDDDRRRECFRKYATVDDSYRDHSDFLRGKSRYAFLFELDRTDYKGWSRGLKKAGYATNPKYADLLIKIIEDNALYRLDQGDIVAYKPSGNPTENAQSGGNTQNTDLFENDFAISAGPGSIQVINRVDYVIAQEGDTFGTLARKYGLMPWELPRYNDLEDDVVIQAGWILFLQPKRNQAEQGMKFHVVRNGDSLWSISQMYGVKLTKILEMNSMKENESLKTGDTIYLRKQRRP